MKRGIASSDRLADFAVAARHAHGLRRAWPDAPLGAFGHPGELGREPRADSGVLVLEEHEGLLEITRPDARRPGRQRSDPQWIGWIDDALRYNWPASERYPRRLGPSSDAFAEVVAVCALAAGLKPLKRALERYPKWRRLQDRTIRQRVMVAALRNTPTLGVK